MISFVHMIGEEKTKVKPGSHVGRCIPDDAHNIGRSRAWLGGASRAGAASGLIKGDDPLLATALAVIALTQGGSSGLE